MLVTVIYLGQDIGFNTIEPIDFKIAEIYKIPSSSTKIDLMRFIGSMNFYSEFFGKLRVNMKPLYDLLFDNTKFHWNNKPETLFQQIKTTLTKKFTVTIPNTNSSFLICTFFFNWYRLVLEKWMMREKRKIFLLFLEFPLLMNKLSVLYVVKYSESYIHY